MTELKINTRHTSEMVDITEEVREAAIKKGIKSGLVAVFTPHTTCSIVLFENIDPKLRRDFLEAMGRIAPAGYGYHHQGENAAAHIKSAICGARVVVPMENAKLMVGQWQGIFLCEFDGPRERRVIVQVIG
ncbi:secondary thiamine-phosphate synthase enzyme YjbQ [Hydrogenimonas urashimensis]|uniref:secondary thiamine-phosphate synthase enzyme YjbQ n=1 Tax=Hydrogenimonas urashimensis TaxID=2740515 RepID=UPI0019169C08|nr:secondary thiamine-phosphate synthase enzyme YjbQ [Hydrogenimonas urashimensis]